MANTSKTLKVVSSLDMRVREGATLMLWQQDGTPEPFRVSYQRWSDNQPETSSFAHYADALAAFNTRRNDHPALRHYPVSDYRQN